jgi:AAA+ ATPase superfamily predicted ATPase
MTEEIQTFLSTLKNPRFTTEDTSPNSPITLDGTLDGKSLQFIATQYDVMEYGREIHQRAQKGDYGKIGPFNPSIEELKVNISSQCAIAISIIIKELGLDDPTRLVTLRFCKEIIISNNGKIPTEGQVGQRLMRVADLYAIPLNTLPAFIKNLEELRFGIAEMSTQLTTNINTSKDKKSLSEALNNFEKDLVTIITLYNASRPPKNLAMPKPIKVSGLQGV